MARIINCWEYKKCGRQPGGEKSEELGTCPAANEAAVHSVNRGTNGGRACWAIGGTMCGGDIQGSFAAKLSSCLKCDFYMKVRDEEAADFVTSKEVLEILGQKQKA